MKLKLVRDKLRTALIEQDKSIMDYDMSKRGYHLIVMEKLQEECNEVCAEINIISGMDQAEHESLKKDERMMAVVKDGLTEELSDVLTVIDTIKELYGISDSELSAAYNSKLRDRGPITNLALWVEDV